MVGLEPFTLGGEPGTLSTTSNSAYELTVKDSIREVLEFKEKGPVFYVNDDPAVRAALEARARARP